jgi:hypothetical protein
MPYRELGRPSWFRCIAVSGPCHDGSPLSRVDANRSARYSSSASVISAAATLLSSGALNAEIILAVSGILQERPVVNDPSQCPEWRFKLLRKYRFMPPALSAAFVTTLGITGAAVIPDPTSLAASNGLRLLRSSHDPRQSLREESPQCRLAYF